jgi:DNA-binding response OmpR family regulator
VGFGFFELIQRQGTTMARFAILIVDDDPDVLQTLQIRLTHQGYRVICASDGRAALEQSRLERPDLVVLDMAMPEMDGIQVCRHLRAQIETAHTPVLFLTGNGTMEGKMAGFNAGANDYVVKPFDLRELEMRIQALLQRSVTAVAPETPSRLVVGDLALNCQTFDLTVQHRIIQLTPVEFDLLRCLMSRPDQVLSAEYLLCQVWHYADHSGKPELVRAHIKNLRNKIEPDSKNPLYLKTVGRFGYMINHAPAAQVVPATSAT